MRKALAALLAAPALARAHHFMDGGLPGTWIEGLLSGLGHPVIGLDHAAFIVAAGFLLARVHRGHWGVAALVLGSLAGATLHLARIGIPGVEAWIALTVILAGILLFARRLPGLPWMIAGLGLAGVLHGHAYAEAIFGAEPAPLGAYLVGFSIMQACVGYAAFAAHRWLLARARHARPVAMGLGAAAGAVGLAFLIA